MKIRKAEKKDINRIHTLLEQVNFIHYQGRRDLFKCANKYHDDEILNLIHDPHTPILVAVDQQDEVMGYAFCIIKEIHNNQLLQDCKTLYVDDLCVDENIRGQHIGSDLMDAVMNLAKELHCYNITLNVWAFNEQAIQFYERYGLKIQKMTMEKLL